MTTTPLQNMSGANLRDLLARPYLAAERRAALVAENNRRAASDSRYTVVVA